MENSPFEHASSQQLTQEVKTFYQRDFKALFLTFFRDPISGLQSFFQNPPEKSFLHAMILYGSVFVLYLAGTYLLVGDMRDYMDFAAFLSIALAPVLIMLAISAMSFVIKLVAGGANFKSELLTGALCGLSLGLVVPIALLFRLFGEGVNPLSLFQSPMAGGGLITVLVLYLFLMMVNVFQQSLKAAGFKDVLAWYLSPVSIMVAIYAGSSIASNLF